MVIATQSGGGACIRPTTKKRPQPAVVLLRRWAVTTPPRPMHKPQLLSQLSFPVYAGQVVFRAAHQQTTTWSLATGRRFAHFFVRPVMFCHVLFGTFSRFAWSPLERQDTADGGPLSPLFCLSVFETEGSTTPVRETATRTRRRDGVSRKADR